MATITQRLAFLVSANADQAIKAFDKTAATAEKQMGKAGKSIDKLGASMTKFGAAGLAAAGTLGAALGRLAQGAIEDQKAQALLADQLRKSTGATDSQIKKVEEMIDATARATGVADDQLRPALGNLVRAFGDTDRASKVLTTALDISAATGRDLETVTIALSRASTGSVGALSRLGIPIDENVKKSKDFNAALVALNEQFGGAAATAADTYAGKMQRAKVAISEAGEQLGMAFVPVVETSATVLGGAINGLASFDKATGGAVAKLATFGTVGLGVISTASLVTGQMIKLRDRFGQVDEATGKLNGKLTTLGKSVALGSAAIGVAALFYADYAATKQKAEQRTRDFADALKAEGDAQKSALAKLIEGKPALATALDTFTKLGINFGELNDKTSVSSQRFKELQAAIKSVKQDDFTISVNDLNKALGHGIELTNIQALALRDFANQIAKGNVLLDAQAQAALDANDALSTHNATTETAVGLAQQLGSVFEQNYKWNEMRNRSVDRGAALTEYQSMLEERASKTAGKNDEARAKAAQKFADEVDVLAGKLEDKLANALKAAEDNAANANKAYDDYRKNIAGSVSGVVNLGEAQATAEENATKLKEANDALFKAQGALSKLGQDPTASADQVAAAVETVRQAKEDLYQAEKLPVTFGDVLKGQVTKAGDFKTNLQKVLDLGGDQALIDQLTSAGADAGNAIITGILSSSDPKGKIDELDNTLANVSALADTIGKSAADTFFQTGVDLATNLLTGVKDTIAGIDVDALKKGKTPKKSIKKTTSATDATLGLLFGAAGLAIPSLADGGIVPARPGGTLVRVGEGGQDEAVLPLPRMQGGSSIVINVTAGMGADGTQIGRQIVDELVAYQRRVGALPIKVAG